MKKIILGLLCMTFSVGVHAWNSDENISTSIFSISLSPSLGSYIYTVDVAGGQIYEGGLNLLSLEYEYRLFTGADATSPLPDAGILCFLEMTGDLYKGHEDSSSLISRVWGLVNAKAGIGVRIARAFGPLELNSSGGVYFVQYFQNLDELWPGFGLTCDAGLIYYFATSIGMGLNGFINYSEHKGGPFPENPNIMRNPFTIIEYGVSVVLSFRV